jgi:NADP-dependent alcohol dehydrogenase
MPRTLAIIAPSHYRYNFEAKKRKISQYAETSLECDRRFYRRKSIERNRKNGSFLPSLGIKTKLSEYTENYQGTAEKIQEAFIARNWLAIGRKRHCKT